MSFSILALGYWIEEQFEIMNGLGAIFILSSTLVLLSLIALNPYGTKSIWSITVTIVWITVGILGIFSCFRLDSIGHRIKFWLFLNLPIAILLYNSFPGERSWDGAGYHNPIALLTFQEGSLWNWPNLIWAQWFPSGQETMSASHLPIFTGLNGLIITNYLWVVVFLNLLHSVTSKDSIKTKNIFLTLVIFLSLPVFFSQLGTTYVDIPVAVLTAAAIFMVANFSKNRFEYVFLVVTFAALIATKWNAIPLIGVISIFGLIRIKGELRTKFNFLFSVALGSIIGILPFVIRNIFSVGNPTFPISGPLGIWEGLFTRSELTSVVDGSNVPELLRNENLFSTLFLEYFASPFIYYWSIASNIFSGGGNAELRSNLSNYLSYDARLGGIGLPLLIIVLFSFFVHINQPRIFLSKLILVSPFVLFSASWWPRYFVGIPIAFALMDYRALLVKVQGKKFVRNACVTLLVFTSIVNLILGIGFKDIQKKNWSSPTGYGGKIAKEIGFQCTKIVVVGSGLTFSGGLWGDRGCNSVVASFGTGSAPMTLGQYGILPLLNKPELTQSFRQFLLDSSEIKEMSIILSGDNLNSEKWVSTIETITRQNFRVLVKTLTMESNGHEVIILKVKK